MAIPFDWMFSLVAGILIFSFLIYFAVQHTDLFGKITTRVVAEELDVLFSGYETTESKSVLDFKKEVELKFSCSTGQGQSFTVNNKEGKNLWGKIIFAPKEIKSDKVNVATMSWDVPFRAANFIYLWDRKYNFENPPNLDILRSIDSTNGDTIIFRFVDHVDESPVCSEDGKIIYYIIEGGYYHGYVCFAKNEESVKFFGEAMMVGAIFTDDRDALICANKLAVNRLEIINEVYKEKANKLIESADQFNYLCSYGEAMYNPSAVNNFDLGNDLNIQFGYDDVNVVETSNENLIREGCPSVY